jgi:hypothetical protein
LAVRAGLPPDTLVGTRGQTIQQAWVSGWEPYLGIAVHGFPNYFIPNGPVRECLQLLTGHTRIEVRRSSQQVFNERVHLRLPRTRRLASAFDVSGPVHDDGYNGPATLTAEGRSQVVRVRLIGHIDPIDGRYHWRGTVFDQLPTELTQARTVILAVGERSVSARITEQTPQGIHSIAGVGAPPFAIADHQVTRVV